MLTLLDTITSFIAPHQCLACGIDGALLCADCQPLLPDVQPQCYRCHRTDGGNKTCKACRASSVVERVWIRTTYDGFGEALLKQLKFERAFAAADTISRAMSELDFLSDAVLVPIPTATNRVRERGYDQAVQIAKQLSRLTGMPVVHALERHGQQRQTGSTRARRLAQLDGALLSRTKRLAGIRSVILVDDVLTTGATLEVAGRALRQAGVKQITGVVFARAA